MYLLMRCYLLTYKEYLQSNQWQGIRKKVFERALNNAKSGNRYGVCERCGYEPKKNCLQVHHKTYLHLFNEPIEDLELLCPKCHRQETERQDKSVFIEKERIIQSMRDKNIEFEIKREIGVLHDNGKVSKELNIVSWNGAEPTYDLRAWCDNPNGTKRPLKGMTLSLAEAEALSKMLEREFTA